MNEFEVLIWWIRIFRIIAAVCATSFPILYAFSPWFKSRVGRALMLQAVAFSFAMDLTTLFYFWRASVTIKLWSGAIVFTLIAFATAWLTGRLWVINYQVRHPKESRDITEA